MRCGSIYIFSKFCDDNYHSFSVVLDFLCTCWVVSVGFSSSEIGLSLCVHELSALFVVDTRIISSYSHEFFLMSLMCKMRKWEWHISQRNSIHCGKSPSTLCGLRFYIHEHSLLLLLSSCHYKIQGNEEKNNYMKKKASLVFKCGLHHSVWS